MADDKLAVINGELAVTGNNLVATADDGSDEWNTCSAAYDIAVPLTVERHNWNFATQIAPLNRVGASPDDQFTDAYAMPDGSLALIWVRLDQAGVETAPAVNEYAADYKIINNQICLTSNGAIPTAKFVANPGIQNWPPLFTAVIRLLVRSAIYRGLHEDTSQADREEAKAEAMLHEARTRTDQQEPRRRIFNSRALAARRVRRPVNISPPGWGGTGNPN